MQVALQPPVDAAGARRLALELFVAGYEGTSLPTSYAARLRNGLAGIILFSRNFRRAASGLLDVAHLTAQTGQIHTASAERSPLAPLCAVDQEGGLVARLRAPFSHFGAMGAVAAKGGEAAAFAVGAQTGRECLAAGFNVDFAPVLDINTNPTNPIIGGRAFGTTAQDVSRLAGAFLRGLQDTGVLGCGKHFPGHGDTDTDSHVALPILDFDLARMESVEMAPFSALAGEMPMVMTAHILFRTLDADLPATLSPTLLAPLLRTHCGFEGVVVSDDLEMKGVAEAFTFSECVRLGLRAGVDLFLVCRREDALEESLDEASRILLAGGADCARALDAVARVRRMRATARHPTPSTDAVQAAIGHADCARLRRAYGLGNV